MLSISDLRKLRVLSPVQFDTDCIRPIVGNSRSTWCLTVENRPKWLSDIGHSDVNMSVNSSGYFQYSLGVAINLRHCGCCSF